MLSVKDLHDRAFCELILIRHQTIFDELLTSIHPDIRAAIFQAYTAASTSILLEISGKE